MRTKFAVAVVLCLGLILLAAPPEAAADWCFIWSQGGLICPHLAGTHPANPGTATFSLPWSGVHVGGGNCTLGAVGPNHTSEGAFVANVTAAGAATGNVNIGWADQAAGPGCFPSFNQNNLTGFFGAGGGYSHNLATATTVFATLTFFGIFGSEEDLEAAVRNLPPEFQTPADRPGP